MTVQDILDVAGTSDGNTSWGDDMRGAMATLHADVSERVILASEHGWDTAASAATNDAAIASAIAAARADDFKPVFLGAGTFQTSAVIDARATATQSTAVTLFGAGPRATTIECTDNTADLIYHGGFRGGLHAFTIRHAGTDPDGTYGDGLVFYKSAYNVYGFLNIDNAGRLISIHQGDVNDPGTGSGTGNWLFSSTLSDITVNRYAANGLYLHSWSGRSTGNVWSNIYVQNKTPGGSPRTSTDRPVSVFLVEDGVFNQLNIEDHSGVGIGLLVNSSGQLVFNSLHFERVALNTFDGQYVRVFGDSGAIINGIAVAFSDVAATGASGSSRLISVASGGRATVRGVSVNNLTKTEAISWYRAAAEDTADCSLEIDYEVELLSGGDPTAFDGDAADTTAQGLKRVGDTLYGLTVPGAAGAVAGAAKMNANGTQALTGFVNTLVTLPDTTHNDELDTTTTANTITIPAGKGGLYAIACAAWFSGGASGERNVSIRVNGSPVVEGGIIGTSGRPLAMTHHVLADGDELTMRAYAEANCDLLGTAPKDVWMSVARVGATP